MSDEVPTAVIVCPDCHGRGEVGGKCCPWCEGYGKRIGPRILQVLTRDDYDRFRDNGLDFPARDDREDEERARYDALSAAETEKPC